MILSVLDAKDAALSDFRTVASYLVIKQNEMNVHRVLPSGSMIPRIQG